MELFEKSIFLFKDPSNFHLLLRQTRAQFPVEHFRSIKFQKLILLLGDLVVYLYTP